MRRAILVSLLVVCCTSFTRAFRHGAPSGACTTLYPGHSAASQSLADSPYTLDVSAFAADGGYVPEKTYRMVLEGSRQFRGLLLQGRSGSTPVGKFTKVSGANIKHSACNPPESAITHTNHAPKDSVEIFWTAPPKGTGSVIFHYAVVVSYDTFYATLQSPVIDEVVTNVYRRSSSVSVRSEGFPTAALQRTVPGNFSVVPSKPFAISHTNGYLTPFQTPLSMLTGVSKTGTEAGKRVGSDDKNGTFANEATEAEDHLSTRPLPIDKEVDNEYHSENRPARLAVESTPAANGPEQPSTPKGNTLSAYASNFSNILVPNSLAFLLVLLICCIVLN